MQSISEPKYVRVYSSPRLIVKPHFNSRYSKPLSSSTQVGEPSPEKSCLSGPIAVKLAGTHMNAVCCQGRSQIWFCHDWLEGKLVDRRAIALVVPLRGCSVDCVRDRILRLDGQSARDMRSEAGAQIMLHHPLSRREAVCFCSGVCTPAERVHELVQPS